MGHSGDRRQSTLPAWPLSPALTMTLGRALLANAARTETRALGPQPNLARIGGIGGSGADRAKARALRNQPNFASVLDVGGGRTNFDGNLRLVLLHDRLQQLIAPPLASTHSWLARAISLASL